MLHKIIIFIYNSFSGGPAAGLRWCTYYGVIGGLSGTSAIMTIAMMSIERYMCVSRPLDPSGRMTRTRALVMVAIIWTYSSVFSFAPLFGINKYVPEGYLTSCSFDYLSDELSSRIFVITFFVAAWCVPLIIICQCYTGIFRSVYKHEEIFHHHAQNFNAPERNVARQNRLELKVAKISIVLISLWTVAWTPYAVVALLGIFSDRSMLTPLTSMLPALFCKVASVLDPFVYGLSDQTFRNELFKRLMRLCKSRTLQNRGVLPSFLKRAISVRSVSNENADISLTDNDRQCEIVLTENPLMPRNVDTPNNTDDSPDDKISDEGTEVECTIGPSPVLKKSVTSDDVGSYGCEIMKTKNGLKSIHVFKIPQICIIERHDDIIKITSRRSF